MRSINNTDKRRIATDRFCSYCTARRTPSCNCMQRAAMLMREEPAEFMDLNDVRNIEDHATKNRFVLTALKKWAYTDPIGKVTVTYEKTHDRFAYITVISGDFEDVINHAAKLVQTDDVTPMYDHMAYQVIGFDFDDPITWIRLYKTTYAGD